MQKRIRFEKLRKSRLLQRSASLMRDERGATMMEYGLIVGLLSVVILLAMTTIGSTMRDDIFNTISTTLQSVLPEDE